MEDVEYYRRQKEAQQKCLEYDKDFCDTFDCYENCERCLKKIQNRIK